MASHWAYKDGASAQEVDWLNRMIDWQGEITDPRQFLEGLKTDLEQDEAFVFTPKGRVVSLPVGATPVDFAYAVHTEVGHSCMGARVNGRLVALEYRLSSGDTCEILTSKAENAAPSQDWLNFVVSTKARSKIKQWWSRERMEDTLDEGRDEFVEELRREGLSWRDVESSAAFVEELRQSGYADAEGVFRAIGLKKVQARPMAQRLAAQLRDGGSEEQLSVPLSRRRSDGSQSRGSIHVDGLDDVLVRLSKCCTPVPGDRIMGFITKGRGVSVHRIDCANAESLEAQQSARIIDVEWANDGGEKPSSPQSR